MCSLRGPRMCSLEDMFTYICMCVCVCGVCVCERERERERERGEREREINDAYLRKQLKHASF